ncbi:MAG: hypothetical protein H6835_17390 [Planctomycetes bacterium]|nr:hypothetical protein [Planctomycetota bacterium]
MTSSAPTPEANAASPRRGASCALGIALLAIAVVFGAWRLWFLCDDAFIAFRYVSNAHDGLGLVWNPPPFRPVEGYTGFLWVLCLWATWSWFGVEPPAAANVLSIAFGLASFAVVAMAALRLRDRRGAPLSTAAVLLTLAVVAGNRTFLTWLTGGLETALFNLAFVTWVVLAFRRGLDRSPRLLAAWAGCAVVAALTRPDGLLPVAATAAVGVWSAFRTRRLAATALSLSPLLLVVAHVGWRVSFYGEWLPNTYYAKVTDPWPEAGLRFLACFLVEHGAWLWPLLAAPWLAIELRRDARGFARGMLEAAPAVVAVLVVSAHVGYYVVRVGGDPFEYRVLSQLVPLGALAVTAMAARIAGSPLAAAASLAVLFASGFGWLHFALHEPTLLPFYKPISARVPAVLRPLAHWHDRQQAWLKVQVLCGRRGAHTLFLDSERAKLPTRQRRPRDPDDVPVAAFLGVGLAGWVLPDVAVLDLLGLNDHVTAHAPVAPSKALPMVTLFDAALAIADTDGDGRYTRAELSAAFAAAGGPPESTDGLVTFLLLLFADRDPDALHQDEARRIGPTVAAMRFMAHERLAPQDYVDALDPNVTVDGEQVLVRPRAQPLSPARIREIEARWWDRPGG